MFEEQPGISVGRFGKIQKSSAALIFGNVVGAVVTVRKGKDILIMSLAVKASYRNYGIGHSLLAKLKEGCLKEQMDEIHLHISFHSPFRPFVCLLLFF